LHPARPGIIDEDRSPSTLPEFANGLISRPGRGTGDGWQRMGQWAYALFFEYFPAGVFLKDGMHYNCHYLYTAKQHPSIVLEQ